MKLSFFSKEFWAHHSLLQFIILLLLALLIIDPLKNGFNLVFRPEKIYQKGFNAIKDFAIKTNEKDLKHLDNIPSEWSYGDFSKGRIGFRLNKKHIIDKIQSNFTINEKNGEGKIEFYNTRENEIIFYLTYPTIGTIKRSTYIGTSDIEEDKQNREKSGVYIELLWNMNENACTNIVINGKMRFKECL